MKRLGAALGLTALGAVTTLTGLAWDAYLHARDPNLVHTESLFTLSNPGHLLLITGVAVTVAGIAAALLLLPMAKVARFTAVGLIGVIALSSAGVLAWAAQTETQQQAAAKLAAKDQLVQGGGTAGTAASGIVTHVHGTTDPAKATTAEKAAAQLLLQQTKLGTEKFADLPRTARRGWHSFRRKFVNDLKPDTPMADLCYLGGWKSPLTVMTVYQQPDQVTMRTALSNRDERRGGTVR